MFSLTAVWLLVKNHFDWPAAAQFGQREQQDWYRHEGNYDQAFGDELSFKGHSNERIQPHKVASDRFVMSE